MGHPKSRIPLLTPSSMRISFSNEVNYLNLQYSLILFFVQLCYPFSTYFIEEILIYAIALIPLCLFLIKFINTVFCDDLPISSLFENRAPTNRFRIDTMGSSEDALYFLNRYNGLSVGQYLRYPCDYRDYHTMMPV